VSGSVVRGINEVALRRARLLLGWVTVFAWVGIPADYRSSQLFIPAGSLNRVPALAAVRRGCYLHLSSCHLATARASDSSLALDYCVCMYVHTYIHLFNGPLSGTTQVSRYQKGKTNLDFTEARDSEWQWHQLGHVCTSLQTDNHASTPPLSF